jgi:DNA primase
MHNPESIVSILEQALGSFYRLKNNETQFFCPKCNHYKRKLQVNLISGKSHCWVCNFSAHNVPQLLRKINASKALIKEAYAITGDSSYRNNKETTEQSISLPKEFKPLWKSSKDIIYKHSLKYLKTRNISYGEIVRYGIGYCDSGIYANRVIVPSYDKNGTLNYFVARDIFPESTMKYKNPPISKDVVCFELLINWNQPIILCEGVFDAISIKKNAIPLLGKVPSRKLIKTIATENVNIIYISLDSDAKQDAVKLAEHFNGTGATK